MTDGGEGALREENRVLRAELESLRALDASRGGELSDLAGKNDALSELVDQLQRKIAELEKRLSKNSTNSSLPPSSDLFTKKQPESPNRAARRALGRKPGKQPGTEGTHLAQVANPDSVETHSPTCCDGCGGDLADAPVDDVEVRQVTEIPVPMVVTTEHRAEKRRCRCGVVTKARFPAHVRSFHSYGPRLRAFALYLLCYQHLPFERAAEAMRDLFGVSVSTGFLDSLYTEGASSLEDFTAAVLARLMAADVVHMDETPIRCATDPKAWIHVACTELVTLLHAATTRGKDGIEGLGLFPGFDGVAVHDRLGWYFDYDAPTHAVCGQHLLRDLASVGVVFSQTGWTSAMTALLLEMKHAGEEARSQGKPALAPSVLRRMNSRYDAIVAEALAANPDPGRRRDSLETESHNLAKAFGDRKDDITRFATDLRVPFTNNIAESALRMAKLRMKIGGCFRSLHGAERLAAVRSYLQSAKKHALEPIAVLTDLFNGEPWIPQRA